MEAKQEENQKRAEGWDKLIKMGHEASKEKALRGRGNQKASMDISSNSTLGTKLAQWEHNPDTKNKNKIKMIHYCMIKWTKEKIR